MCETIPKDNPTRSDIGEDNDIGQRLILTSMCKFRHNHLNGKQGGLCG